MKDTYLNSDLRRTSFAEEAMFVETDYGHTRATRSYEKNTVEAAKATCRGRKFHPVGNGEIDETMVLGEFVFTWTPGRVWEFAGKFYRIALEPTCSREDAKVWLKAFLAAEKESSVMHKGNKISHVLGMTPDKNQYVASARDNLIVWYNLEGEDRLYAAALVDATKGKVNPIVLPRMIHHEVAHTYESKMRDWLSALTPTIATMDLQPLAQELNSRYLPSRIEAWSKDCARLAKRKMTPKAREREKELSDESLAAEFLVETYVHLVIEKKPWKAGLWPCMDAVVDQMKTRVLIPSGEAQEAHQPLASMPTRIMIAPETLTFGGRGAKREVSLA